jgi:hypothetical protein
LPNYRVVDRRRKQFTACGPAEGKQQHQPRPRRRRAVVIADFCNKIGTFQTSSDVCFPVAIGVTTDMPLQREIGRS